jgi:D-glycero-D-manno-heptose 1,7-bisphosphate phosphatase
MKRRAVFLDRDGTLVHVRHYPSRPEDLVLYDGLVTWLARLKAAGYALVMITNQSGIARGLFTAGDLNRMHDSLQASLRASGAELDGIYFCPHHPEGSVEEYAIECACRKPGPGMLHAAASDLDLDLDRSWFVGDILDDIEAGNRARCRTVLVDLGTESAPTDPFRRPTYVAPTTVDAVQLIMSVDGFGPATDLGYAPTSWKASRDAARAPRQADMIRPFESVGGDARR